MLVARLSAAVPVLAALVLAGSASAAGTAAAHVAVCSSYGPTWLRSYNRKAVKQGNPVRIVSACCHPTRLLGINHCFVMVTLAGTRDRGCESVDIGRNGLPAGPGKHESCLAHTTRQTIA